MEFNSFHCLSVHHGCNFTSKGVWLTFGPVKMKVKMCVPINAWVRLPVPSSSIIFSLKFKKVVLRVENSKSNMNRPKLKSLEDDFWELADVCGATCLGELCPLEAPAGLGEVGVPRLPLLSFLGPLTKLYIQKSFNWKFKIKCNTQSGSSSIGKLCLILFWINKSGLKNGKILKRKQV